MKRIFPRQPGPTKDLAIRSRAAAHRLLDQAERGDVEVWDRVDWALRVTGDLPPDSESRHFITEVLVCVP